MVGLLIVRHGLSLTNKDKRYTGQTDVPLAPLGFAQGEAVSRYIAENYSVDAIYSSDLCRAVETLAPLGRILSLPIRKHAGLREFAMGEWEGKTYAEVKELFPETCALLKTEKWRVRYDGGESYEEMHRRVTAAFAEIIAENEGKTVAVASHGGAIRMYLATALGIPLQSVEKAPTVSNASLTVVEIENGEARIALLGEDGFLAEERFAVDKELH